jgi:hypothetical protein
MQINDDYAEGLLNEGHLGISTGFLCADDGDKLTGELYPNHILVFFEDVNNLPADFGAGFLNKLNLRSDIMADGKDGDPAGNGGQNGGGNDGNGGNGGNGGGPGEGGNNGAFNPENNLPPLGAVQAQGADLQNYLQLRGQYTRDMNQASATITSLSDTVENLKARLHAFEVEEKERKITSIIGDLPKGVKAGLQETELRERLNKNPLTALEDIIQRYNKAIDSLSQARGNPEGQQYLHRNPSAQSGNPSAPSARKPYTNNQNGQPLDPRDTQGLAAAFYFDDEAVE